MKWLANSPIEAYWPPTSRPERSSTETPPLRGSFLPATIAQMARRSLGSPPYPPICLVDTDNQLVLDDVQQTRRRWKTGVSLCVRTKHGPPNRGGYFFHFKQSKHATNQFSLCDFEGRHVGDFSLEDLLDFINHCSGRRFDMKSFIRCQQFINLLKDS